MKAFLLAAGHGSRLRPLTDKIPKCLVPIRGVPILQIWLDTCCRFGINDVLINIHSHADQVTDFLRARSSGPAVTLVSEHTLLGSAGTLLTNRDWIGNDDCFWIFYADVLHRADLHAMLRFHQSCGAAATLGTYRVAKPERCGIVTADEQNVIRGFAEKPKIPTGDSAFSGIMIGTEKVLDAIPHTFPADIGYDVLPQLLGHMVAFPIDDYLLDIGTMENYRAAQETWPG